MKQILIEKVRAAEQVSLLFSQNTAIAALVVGCTPLLQAIDGYNASIYADDTQLQGLSKLNVQPKGKLRKALEEKVFEVSARATGYAINTANAPLEQVLTTTLSLLTKKPDFNLRDYAQMVYDTVNAIIADIDASYRVLPVDLTDLQTLIDNFSGLLPGAGSRIAQIKQLNEALNQAADGQTAAFKTLDKLVEMVRFDQAAFYKAYKSARMPKKVSVSKQAVALTIIDKATQAPLYKATATFVAQKTSKKTVKSSSKNGVIILPTLIEDMYNLTIVEVGYTTYTETIAVRDGQTYKNVVALESVSL
jgi:hypothetical protein